MRWYKKPEREVPWEDPWKKTFMFFPLWLGDVGKNGVWVWLEWVESRKVCKVTMFGHAIFYEEVVEYRLCD